MSLALMLLAMACAAAAHVGPAYPILIDQKAGPYTVSLWGDPDTGVGTFFILADAGTQGQSHDDTAAELWVQPATKRLPATRCAGVREPARSGLRFVARPPFDAEERWHLRVILSGSRGGGEVDAEVDVTPPDLGRTGMIFYLLPFLGIGALWAKAALARRRPSSRP